MATSQDIANRVPITVGLMLATVMNSLDTTIANVALPHMPGSGLGLARTRSPGC